MAVVNMPKEFYLPFIKKEQLTKDAYSFYFDSVRCGFDFLPGQYIRMTLNIKNPDNRGNSRFFTIASSPLEKEHIMITTRIIESSFKQKLLTLKGGDMVKFYGQMGGFVLDENKKESRIFLAGGIGITPFHSMIIYAQVKKLSIPITLLVSFSTVEDMVFRDELEDIVNKNPHIKVIYTVTQSEKSRIEWKGEIGRISEDLIKKYVSNILDPQYFIVGPPAMVAAIEEVVRNMGVSPEKIFIENFTGY